MKLCGAFTLEEEKLSSWKRRQRVKPCRKTGAEVAHPRLFQVAGTVDDPEGEDLGVAVAPCHSLNRRARRSVWQNFVKNRDQCG